MGLEGTLKDMAGRKRHSAEDIVRKLRRADELAAAGQTGEQIAADRLLADAELEKDALREIAKLLDPMPRS